MRIGEVYSGWIELIINNHKFDVSYLSNFEYEIKELFKFSYLYDDIDINRILLEGEGQGDLYLSSWKHPYEDKIFILWEEPFLDNPIRDIIELPYTETKRYINKWFEDNKKNYKYNFECGVYMEKFDDFDSFKFNLKILEDKNNINLDLYEEIDYDYEENPYILNTSIVMKDNNGNIKDI